MFRLTSRPEEVHYLQAINDEPTCCVPVLAYANWLACIPGVCPSYITALRFLVSRGKRPKLGLWWAENPDSRHNLPLELSRAEYARWEARSAPRCPSDTWVTVCEGWESLCLSGTNPETLF